MAVFFIHGFAIPVNRGLCIALLSKQVIRDFPNGGLFLPQTLFGIFFINYIGGSVSGSLMINPEAEPKETLGTSFERRSR